MNQIKVKLRLNQTMKCSYQPSRCHQRSCLGFVLTADDLLKYDLCFQIQNVSKVFQKKLKEVTVKKNYVVRQDF